jgi:hypothetical protein
MNFFDLPNPSGRTGPEIETGKKIFLGNKALPMFMADDSTAICESII